MRISESKSRWMAILWTTAVIVGSLMSGGSLNTGLPIMRVDKVLHFVAYFGMALLWARGLGLAKKIGPLSLLLIVLALLGWAIEIGQIKISTDRYYETSDIIANIVGAICGVVVYRLLDLK